MDNGLTIDLVGAAPKDYLIIIESFYQIPTTLLLWVIFVVDHLSYFYC